MRLTRETINAISKQAVAEYPAECCGIVTASATAQRFHSCKNRQDELHAKNPEQHPRTSREAYDIDRSELNRILTNAKAASEQVIAFYHSHIDCGAYFSQMDKDVLTIFGEPEFPDAIHVVVSVQDRKVKEISGYAWNREKRDFVRVDVIPH